MSISEQNVTIDYTNHRGKRAIRHIIPVCIKFAANEYHMQQQWLVVAYDLDEHGYRDFAMKNIHSWKVET